MRFARALVVAVSLLAGCKKSSTTAPIVVTAATVSGSWSGCLTLPGVSCSPVSMALTDSVVTDSTGTIRGTGSWLTVVNISGARLDSTVTLHAIQAGQTLGWVFTGVVSGSSLTGNMTGPSIASAAPATFTRSP